MATAFQPTAFQNDSFQITLVVRLGGRMSPARVFRVKVPPDVRTMSISENRDMLVGANNRRMLA